MIRWLRNRLWAWRHRCKRVRMLPGNLPGIYIPVSVIRHCADYLQRTYEPCKVCGELTCRWAELKSRGTRHRKSRSPRR